MSNSDFLKSLRSPASPHVKTLFGRCSCGQDHGSTGFTASAVVADASDEKAKAARRAAVDAVRAKGADADFFSLKR